MTIPFKLVFVPPAFRCVGLLQRTSFVNHSLALSSRKSTHCSWPLYCIPARSAVVASMPEPNSVSTVDATSNEVSVPGEPPVKFLKDYKPPFYTISQTHLDFSLDDDGLNTLVSAKLSVAPRDSTLSSQPLVLDGEALELISDSLKVSGSALPSSAYTYDTLVGTLTILPDFLPNGSFDVESVVRIKPVKNTLLEGLYMSAGDYCTQCEAEGFRKITFYLDRPDVMAKFFVGIEADRVKYPVLLSNGNCIGRGDSQDGRHWARFEDTFPKPSYLFALVAGNLACMKDTFTTMGGRDVSLSVYVKGESEVRKCAHAMASLKRAMKWDEETFGLEYNYDTFNIVAVPSFVFGAMENTSLNIFNSKYVLVSPETATDTDFNNVEGVVAHEYFHNYSGNRVTVSSWFQLSLKEGLTVFRDQSFSADMNSATAKRISDVTILRAAQFAEDAGPMSHPIRPESYITCNSFYTATVYNKGAEVIRMLKTIVGPQGFRRGTDIYFSRHDGQAVTCEDWIQAIQDGNPDIDLSVFRRWYSTSGTPVVKVNVVHEAAQQTMTLTCNQSVPPTPKQPTSDPLVIPLRIGIIAPDGSPVPVDLHDGTEPTFSRVLMFDQRNASFVCHGVPEGSVPSLLREFSAPVKLIRKDNVSRKELAFLMAGDTDEFNKWESGQQLMLDFILECVTGSKDFGPLPDELTSAFRKTLLNNEVDATLRGQVFIPPAESYVLEQLEDVDPMRVRGALDHLRCELGTKLEAEFTKVVEIGLGDKGEYKLDPDSQGKRALKNVALTYLAALEKKETYRLCLNIVRTGSNMTDVLAALGCLVSSESEEREIALREFYNKWENDQLVVDKWLRMQSTAKRDGVTKKVIELTTHKAYTETVPNCVYALLGGFGAWNVHMPVDGSGYRFLADQVIHLDRLNPQVAARIARSFTRWRKFEFSRRDQMEAELQRIKSTEKLSKDVFEVVNNCLASV